MKSTPNVRLLKNFLVLCGNGSWGNRWKGRCAGLKQAAAAGLL